MGRLTNRLAHSVMNVNLSHAEVARLITLDERDEALDLTPTKEGTFLACPICGEYLAPIDKATGEASKAALSVYKFCRECGQRLTGKPVDMRENIPFEEMN